MSTDPGVPVPVDLEVAERLVGPVTVAMAAWLSPAVAGGLLVGLTRPAVGLDALGGLLLVVGLLGALWRPAGRPAPAWLRPLLGYRSRSRSRTGSRKGSRSHPHRAPLRSRVRRAAPVAASLLAMGLAFTAGHLVHAHAPLPGAPAPATQAPVSVPPDGEVGCGC